MLWKCCTQYVSQFGKLSSGHRTGKCQFSFQSQRKAMPKNTQTIAQLNSSHTLVKWCSKFSKPGFSNTWSVNSQMFKLDLEKAEEPEIKLPTSSGSSKNQVSFRKTSISDLLTTQNPLTVWITTNCGKFWKRWEYQTTWPACREICMQVRKQQWELDMNNQLVPNRVHQGCILSPCLFNLYAEYIMRNAGLEEAQAGIKIAGEKYQYPQICRWHHPYGRKWRGTQKPPDEGESGEWKSWLKAQHSENEDHGIRSHHFMGNSWGNSGNSVRLFSLENNKYPEIFAHVNLLS